MSTRAARTYRVFLRLLPAAIRKQRGKAMERLFLDMLQSAATSRRRAWVCLIAIGDVVRHAGGMRLQAGWTFLRGALRTRGRGSMRDVGHDIRIGMRQLKRYPGYVLAVVSLTAIGVGGNAGAFRVFDGLFLDALPFPNADRLVDIDITAPAWDLEYVHVAYPDFAAWRRENRTFDQMALFDEGSGNVSGDAAFERVPTLITTHDIDDVLGLRPLTGRFYTEVESVPNGPAVGMISAGFWERRYGRDPSAVGRSLTVNGFTFEIIGVLPPEAQLIREADVWFPVQRGDTDGEGNFTYRAIGLLAPGVTVKQARDDLNAIHRARTVELGRDDVTSPTVIPMRDRYLGAYHLGAVFALFAVGGVLLLACVNIAGLVLARSITRTQEITLRLALGASRSRVARQLFTENLMLAFIGAIGGSTFGVWGSSLIIRGMRDQLPPWVNFELDVSLIFFISAITVASAVAFGFIPAVHATTSAASSAATRVTASRGRARALGGLLAGQVALAVTLLVAGGSVALDVYRLGRIDPGFRAERLTTLRVSTAGSSFTTPEQRVQFVDDLTARVASIPGVEAASVVSQLPLTDEWGVFLSIDGRPREESESTPVVQHMVVTPSHFETMGIRLMEGRGFNEFDGRTEGSRVAMVSTSLARAYLDPDQSVLGQRINDGGGWMTIVGLVEDIRHKGVTEEASLSLYKPFPQRPLISFDLAVRATTIDMPITSSIRALIRSEYPDVAVYNEMTMESILNADLWSRRATAWVIGGFSIVALLVTVVGLYGTISFIIGQRDREIGVRLVLGATPRDVLRAIVGRAGAVVTVGSLIGVATAIVVAPLTNQLTVVASGEKNPVVLTSVTLLVVLVTVGASFLAARRASRIEPLIALRAQ